MVERVAKNSETKITRIDGRGQKASNSLSPEANELIRCHIRNFHAVESDYSRVKSR